MPFGLLVNEILTNSLKHAFPNGASGFIDISLQNHSQNQLELIIEDNGSGFSDEQLVKESFGLDLIKLLVAQLEENLMVESTNKTKYKILFQEITD